MALPSPSAPASGCPTRRVRGAETGGDAKVTYGSRPWKRGVAPADGRADVGPDRSQRRPRRGLRPLEARRRRRRCSTWSPAPTSPAASTPATRAPAARPARRPPSAGSAIGAQVGYRDLAGFGRRFIDMEPDELPPRCIYQIGALQAIARAAGGRVAYVKPHGALYNAIVHAPRSRPAPWSTAVAGGTTRPCRCSACPGRRARRGRGGRAAHRRARRSPTAPTPPDGTLVSRRRARRGAARPGRGRRAAASRMATDGLVDRGRRRDRARSTADSICVHGDTPGAVEHGPRGPRRAGDAAGRRRSAPFA